MTLVTILVGSVTSTCLRSSFGDIRTFSGADVAGLIRDLARPKLDDRRLGREHGPGRANQMTGKSVLRDAWRRLLLFLLVATY